MTQQGESGIENPENFPEQSGQKDEVRKIFQREDKKGPFYTPERVAEQLSSSKEGKRQATFSMICAVISILFLPVIFGIAGMIFGARAKSKGAENLGQATMILSCFFMIIGILLSMFAELPEGTASAIGGVTGIALKSL